MILFVEFKANGTLVHLANSLTVIKALVNPLRFHEQAA